MRVILKGLPLSPEGAQALRQQIAGDRSNPSVDALLTHVIDCGAKYTIIEAPYIDRDYTSDYLSFYAGAFKDHARATKRVHFFSEDVSKIFTEPLIEQVAALEKLKGGSYLGFAVIRPIAQGPLGRTVLRFPDLKELTVRPAARAEFGSHILGAELAVVGAPFIQQDMKLGACAQASIWMAARAVETRHRRTQSHTIAEITGFATNPTDSELSRSLPAGSEGLNPMHMIRALRGMGHQPLHMLFEEPDEELKSEKPPLNAGEVVLRYLDSGLPVILAMSDIGHAICAVGYIEERGAAVHDGTSHAVFARGLVVHDDQRGPYRIMPMTAADADKLPNDRLIRSGERVLTVEDVSHMFVPLPLRVFLRAENADIVVRDYLRSTGDIANRFVEFVGRFGDKSAKVVGEFFDEVKSGLYIQRTYLTTAGKYRSHIAGSEMPESVKLEVISRSLPHFVWVTEIIERKAVQEGPDGARRVAAHFVLNATSSTDHSSDLLLAQLPHVVVHRNINPAPADDIVVDFEEEALHFEDHRPYLGRVRTL